MNYQHVVYLIISMECLNFPLSLVNLTHQCSLHTSWMVQRKLSQLEKLRESFGALPCDRAMHTAQQPVGWRRTWRNLFYLIQSFSSKPPSGHMELLMCSRYMNCDEYETTAWHNFGGVSALYKFNLLISAFGAILYSHYVLIFKELYRMKNIYNAIN